MISSNLQGVLLSGVVKGFRPRIWDGKVVGYELGISSQVADGFGGFSEDLKIVRVDEKQQAAVQNAANRLTGKPVIIQVEISAYAPKNGKPIAQFNYVADSQIISLTDVDPFSGESLKKTA